jgi:hypothetical protein
LSGAIIEEAGKMPALPGTIKKNEKVLFWFLGRAIKPYPITAPPKAPGAGLGFL